MEAEIWTKWRLSVYLENASAFNSLRTDRKLQLILCEKTIAIKWISSGYWIDSDSNWKGVLSSNLEWKKKLLKTQHSKN